MNNLLVIIKYIVKLGAWIGSFVSCFIAAVLIGSLVPIDNNYRFLFVQSGSMEPSVPVGSMVLVAPQVQYQIGDIVTFSSSNKDPDKLVTHRISGFSDQVFGLLYETKGDANKTIDPAPLEAERIKGRVLITMPYVGYLLNGVKTPYGFILAVIVPSTILIYEELKRIYKAFKDYLKNIKRRESNQETIVLQREDEQLLQSIQRLKEEHISFAIPAVVAGILFGMGFAFVGFTHGFFSDTEKSGGVFISAANFPSPSSSPVPSSTPTPGTAHIVINEVYYDVDQVHGKDSPGDRGVTVGGHATKVNISGNGTLSQNSAFVDIESLCSVVQTNQTNVDINLQIEGNTGGTTGFGNVINNLNLESGSVANSLVIDIQGGTNTLSQFCQGQDSRNHEWIELYNPSSQPISLKDWTITDNSGIEVKIPGNRTIDAKEFVLISKSNSTWNFWDEPSGVTKIPLNRQIGDGLDDRGDHLILKDNNGNVVDKMSYGGDSSVFNLPEVDAGHSVERDPDGTDTDAASEWKDRLLPMPGT